MNELLLGSALGSNLPFPVIPNSGPGPQKLIGYYAEDNGPGTQKGFFGETSTSDLISGNDLASWLGLTAGTAQNNTRPWLKFLIDNQIYFVAKQPYRHTISWDQINSVGAVDGSKIIEIGGYRFEVGLLEGIGKDHSVISTGYDTPLSHGSEWNRLMYNVTATIPADVRSSQVGDQWANYNQAGVAGGLWLSAGDGRRTWCKEVWPANTTRRVFRGDSSVSRLSYITSSSASSTYGWRPCLKLITA